VVQLDRQGSESPGDIRVWSSTTVVVRIFNKSPLEDCGIEYSVPAVARPQEARLKFADLSDAIEKSISIVSLTSTGSTGAVRAGGAATGSSPDDVLIGLENLTDYTASAYRATADNTKQVANSLRKLLTITEARPDSFGVVSARSTDADFQRNRESLQSELEAFLGAVPPDLTPLRTELTFAEKRLQQAGILESSEDPAKFALYRRLRIQSQRLQALEQSASLMKDVKNLLRPATNALDELRSTATVQSVRIPGASHPEYRGNLVCAHSVTGQVTTTMPIHVVYRPLWPLGISIGGIVSSVAQKEYVVESCGLGCAAKPIESTTRAVPFLFLNMRVATPRIFGHVFAVNLSPGMGWTAAAKHVVPNYALGPSLALNSWHVFVGAHAGKSQEIQPSEKQFLTTSPRDVGIAAGISYDLTGTLWTLFSHRSRR
jgi:hypothetical protein